ncbi:MAG: 30S ribosomal protein S5 [Nanoarchaeota archaeon]|nr:30S ribosomal protein S5 [Nanoarchaeota archaeon]
MKKPEESGVANAKGFDMSAWQPKTALGKKVKAGEITNIDEILNKGYRILESEIVDALLPDLEKDLLAIGQSKGKFGGGKKSIWKQTQKKSKEGNKPSFTTMAIVGNRNGYVGMGMGKARETMPAREKATRKAKLNIIKVKRGCGSWECGCGEQHSIPFAITGKCGSISITLKPAPKGTNLIINKECQKILDFAGIRDIYSKTLGQTSTKMNLVKACFYALKNLADIKIKKQFIRKVGLAKNE